MPNDSQRSKVYHAEYRFRDQLDSLALHPKEERWSDLEGAQAFSDTVCELEGRDPIHVAFNLRPNARTSYYRPSDRSITLAPDWAKRSAVLLHELAHYLTDAYYPSHGGEFTLTLLRLLDKYSAESHGRLLASQYVEHKVKVGSRPDLALLRAKQILKRSAFDDPLVSVIYKNGLHPSQLVARLVAVSGYSITIARVAPASGGEVEFDEQHLRYVTRI